METDSLPMSSSLEIAKLYAIIEGMVYFKQRLRENPDADRELIGQHAENHAALRARKMFHYLGKG